MTSLLNNLMTVESTVTKMIKVETTYRQTCAAGVEAYLVDEHAGGRVAEECLPFVDILFQNEAASEETLVTFYTPESMGLPFENDLERMTLIQCCLQGLCTHFLASSTKEVYIIHLGNPSPIKASQNIIIQTTLLVVLHTQSPDIGVGSLL